MIDATKLKEAIERSATEAQISGAFLAVMRRTIRNDDFYLLEEAAKAYLAALPKTKEVEVYHVEYASADNCARVSVRSTKELADNLAALLQAEGNACIRVTGPHKHVVPA